jgi:hypothetical protein
MPSVESQIKHACYHAWREVQMSSSTTCCCCAWPSYHTWYVSFHAWHEVKYQAVMLTVVMYDLATIHGRRIHAWCKVQISNHATCCCHAWHSYHTWYIFLFCCSQACTMYGMRIHAWLYFCSWTCIMHGIMHDMHWAIYPLTNTTGAFNNAPPINPSLR